MKIKILKRTSKPDWLLVDSPQIADFEVIISWDTEWRNKEWELDLKKAKVLREETEPEIIKTKIREIDLLRTRDSLFNQIISYQLCLYSRAKNCYVEALIYLIKDDQSFSNRLTLSRLLSISFELLGYDWSEINEQKTLLISHFSVAEFSALTLSDRKSLTKSKSRKLDKIQNTICSFSYFSWRVSKYNSFSVSEKVHISEKKIKLMWRDTILLAPPKVRSLQKLSTQTSCQKIELKPEQMINMVELWQKQPELYEQYAINDARIVIEFFCKFMNVYYHVTTQKRVTKMPVTAVGSAELNYLSWQEEESKKMGFCKNRLRKLVFGIEDKRMKIRSRSNDESLVNKSYLGGRSGNFRYYESYELRSIRKIAIGLDISSAYARGFGCLVVPDWGTRNKRLVSREEYAEDIIDFYNQKVEYSKIGFFDTKFKYPKGTFEPGLGQRTDWGIIFTREGETRATFPEIVEAKKVGAINKGDIQEVILYREQLINGKIYYPFADFIKLMQKEREIYSKESFENELYKIQINGLYGKTGQGVESKEEIKTFFSLTGEKEKLKPSAISCAEYASHITGIIRTALGSVANTIEEYPGCEIVNLTTDGLTMIMNLDAPGSTWFGRKYPEFLIDEEGKIKSNLSLRDINPELWKQLEELDIVQMIKRGGEKVGVKANWLEIKEFGDCLTSNTNRGNWMTWQGLTQSLARGGISGKVIKDAQDYQRYAERNEITEAMIDNLVGIREIIEEGCDLVIKRKIEKGKRGKNLYLQSFRKVNLGPEAKRKVLADGINTEPFTNYQEAEEYRKKIEGMARKKIRKTTENVLWETNKKKTRGNKKEVLIKEAIGWILNNTKLTKKYRELAEIFNKAKILNREITVKDLKNWKVRNNKGIEYQELTNQINKIRNLLNKHN